MYRTKKLKSKYGLIGVVGRATGLPTEVKVKSLFQKFYISKKNYPREPRWKAMTGGTDCWNRDDAYNSVASPPRQTKKKNRDW